jgi:hypothetical protein
MAALVVITSTFIIVLVVNLTSKIVTNSAVFVTSNKGAATSRSSTFEGEPLLRTFGPWHVLQKAWRALLIL